MANFSSKKKRTFRVGFRDLSESMAANKKGFAFFALLMIVLTALSAVAIFFVNVKGAEQVLVPDVVGKDLTEALLELQEKELYPRIQLRYSDAPEDRGKILEQSPEAGAIRKGYSRVSLTVSRGVVIDRVGNYIGQNIDDVRMNLQTLFAGTSRALIVVGNPQYRADSSDAGTILEQDPPEGTAISDPVTVNFVVSRGPNFENTRVPDIVGLSVNDVLQQMSRTRLVFDFTSREAQEGETAGTVVSEQRFDDEFVPNYTRVSAEFALPSGELNGNVYGIFSAALPNYPYAVTITLRAIPQEGEPYTLVTLTHPGGNVTIPYAVPSGTELALFVVSSSGEREQRRIVVY